MLLEISGLQASYGSSQALFGVDLWINEGEVVSLLGRNGMGKTTTIRNIVGLMRPIRGKVVFAGTTTNDLQAFRVSRMGIGLVPEGRQVFSTLSVRENLVATAANRRNVTSPWTLDRVEAFFPILKERARQQASQLSGGEQQMLAIGRALMTNPRLLILDEATEGLAPLIRQDVWNSLRLLRESDLAILVIDKNVGELKQLADRHYLMNKGRIAWEGTTSDMEQQSEAVDKFLHF